MMAGENNLTNGHSVLHGIIYRRHAQMIQTTRGKREIEGVGGI